MLSSLKNYFRMSRSATYSFISILPLLFMYEVLIFAVNPEPRMMIRVGADIWIKKVLTSIGGMEQLSIGLVTLILGMIICYYEKDKEIKVDYAYFPCMLLESLFYSIFLGFIVSAATTKIFHGLTWKIPILLELNFSEKANEFWLQIALSLGAGLYEELLFRVLLVSGLFGLFKLFMVKSEKTAYAAAAILAALLFSGVHYIGSLGDAFTLSSFTFRFLFGLALNVLYVLRGFGIAAWSHAIYDILVVTFISGNA